MYRESLVPAGSVQLNLMTSDPVGPPLLLLHGVIRLWQTFLPLLPHLVERWQLHGLDLPGHGKSERLMGKYLVADYVRVTAELVRTHFSQPIVIYGHSLGAMVAAGAAAELGARARAVILEDPPLDTMASRIQETWLHSYFAGLAVHAGSPQPAARLARELANLVTVDPQTGRSQRLGDVRDAAQLRFMASCLKQLDPAVLRPVIEARWLAGFDWPQVFSRIACPLLLLQADEAAGGMLMDADAALAASLAADCTLVKLSGCGHNMHVGRTQDVANLVHAFLEGLDEESPHFPRSGE
jgi:pimeloyl-ACP methyl ester carboxylesterase